MKQINNLTKKALVVMLLLVLPGYLMATTYYVDIDKADDTGDGLSWATAKKYLQSAYAMASSGDEIWVADGVYYPDEGTGVTNNDQAAKFDLKDGVKLYGGFVGTESRPMQRDWATNLTILSGDIEQDDTNTDGNFIAETYTDIQGGNSNRILNVDASATSITSSCEVNGFYITAGYVWRRRMWDILLFRISI